MKDQWINRAIDEQSPILKHMPGASPGSYRVMIDMYNGQLMIEDVNSDKKWSIPCSSAGDVQRLLMSATSDSVPKNKKQLVKFTLPDGQIIEVQLTNRGDFKNDGRDQDDILIRPLNYHGSVHHHVFKSRYDNEYHLLIRDSNTQNIEAYVLDLETGRYRSRPLTDAEKKAR